MAEPHFVFVRDGAEPSSQGDSEICKLLVVLARRASVGGRLNQALGGGLIAYAQRTEKGAVAIGARWDMPDEIIDSMLDLALRVILGGEEPRQCRGCHRRPATVARAARPPRSPYRSVRDARTDAALRRWRMLGVSHPASLIRASDAAICVLDALG
jgi:hypothetical protein